jgi:hypothetical protein
LRLLDDFTDGFDETTLPLQGQLLHPASHLLLPHSPFAHTAGGGEDGHFPSAQGLEAPRSNASKIPILSPI